MRAISSVKSVLRSRWAANRRISARPSIRIRRSASPSAWRRRCSRGIARIFRRRRRNSSGYRLPRIALDQRENEMSVTKTAAPQKKPFYKILYVQVLVAIVVGAIVGWLFPEFAKNEWIKAMGDGFVKLIKMLIAPIIFCTVVSGIAHISEVKKVGRVAVKALVYFEFVSTFALALGLIVANVLRPGSGFQGQSNATVVAGYAKQASEM